MRHLLDFISNHNTSSTSNLLNLLEVMKIDVSKNDVPHDKIDVWDVPSVYYFPAGEKDNPVEVTWIGPERNPRTDYYEGELFLEFLSNNHHPFF